MALMLITVIAAKVKNSKDFRCITNADQDGIELML